ncbi:ecotropic viral integration site 5 ortholog-like isoform X2 [Ruditapes philippinarum]|uniref:ecotropic viral integration site 5 ortholog-like isoform X2 n=1 Tax=Ruditapes philippinarum TaxID=129788 RepID=UPI00295B6A17|nr:ecotropic viral integration site 5 ortholog-like isoform X2 [Ruditapes philippinarum]
MLKLWLESFRDDVFSDWSTDNTEDSDNVSDDDNNHDNDDDDKKKQEKRHHQHHKKHVNKEIEHLLKKKKSAVNRLLEADKKGITPSHSRSESSSGLVGNGHSRKGSSTSQISTNSSTSQQVEEDAGNSGNNLWEIWGKLVNDWASAKKKPAFIKQLVRKGIPHPFRGLAWQLLLGVNHSPMKDMYVEYLKQKSPSEKMIRRDIARTFPEHDFFKEKDGVGQESLFNVMKAYSLHDREVGYCQGSGFIVGLLLMQMPEEEAFAVLVKLMQDYRLRELFKPSMAELGLCMYKLECLIQELLPDLFTHFQTQCFHTSMYASSWFLTLFATNIPLSVACRVMDLFISEGMDVIFRIGIAILQSSQPHLLSMDMECMLQHFQKDVSILFQRDEDTLFNMAYQIRFSAKKFKRLEKEYTALKSKENEDQIELRRLRTENRLLRQRIDNLEKESASLADRLIQYQLTRAQEAEETYALKNELSLIKQKYSLSQKQLKDAEALLGDIKERTDSIHSASSLDEGEAQVVIQSLQEELIMVRLREAENSDTIKRLRTKIDELEQLNTRLQQAPSNDVQCLQEELIAVKLREAEANLSLKEMRQIITDLESNWQNHLASVDPVSSPKEKNNKSELKSELKRTQEELMTSKLREAGALSHLKDAKQRVMELETSNQICNNQIRRMDDENKRLKSEIEEHSKSDEELSKQIKTLLRKIDDLESKRREESMMARIREAESDQLVGELKQKIAQIEIQREEVLAADQLESKGGKQDLENTIYDLQEEVMQLKMAASPKSPNTSASSSSTRSASKVEDDEFNDNDDDDDDIEDPESLNRTLSEIIEGKRSSTSLIAILNRDNSDCDSIKSSSSEASGTSLKLAKSNSFKGSKTGDFDRLTSVEESGNMREINLGAVNQSSGDIDENSAINKSSCDREKSEEQSDFLTGSQTCVQNNDKNSAITEAQSKKEINELANGEVLPEIDANENISVKGEVKQSTENANKTSCSNVSA